MTVAVFLPSLHTRPGLQPIAASCSSIQSMLSLTEKNTEVVNWLHFGLSYGDLPATVTPTSSPSGSNNAPPLSPRHTPALKRSILVFGSKLFHESSVSRRSPQP